MIIIDNEWSFIHAPKTSGTNFTLCFPDNRIIKYTGNQFWDEFWQQKSPEFAINIREKINVVKHAPLSFWQKQNIVTHHKIFTIVRNPYTRLVSFFNEFKRDMNIPHLTLNEFITNSDICEGLKMIPYNIFSLNMNQLDFFLSIDNHISLDKFYKMEDELEKVEKFFNIKDINLHKHNSSCYDRNYKDIFTDEIISWVQMNYKKDFDYFNYNLDPFWL
tara:strand:- start:99 stop:752 length:654 start_codon:yes stop_codon:yes gene_type:complete